MKRTRIERRLILLGILAEFRIPVTDAAAVYAAFTVRYVDGKLCKGVCAEKLSIDRGLSWFYTKPGGYIETCLGIAPPKATQETQKVNDSASMTVNGEKYVRVGRSWHKAAQQNAKTDSIGDSVAKKSDTSDAFHEGWAAAFGYAKKHGMLAKPLGNVKASMPFTETVKYDECSNSIGDATIIAPEVPVAENKPTEVIVGGVKVVLDAPKGIEIVVRS